MRVLVACEYSGTVRDAFRSRGHDAMSCDLLPTDVDGPHHQGDVRDILNDGWDLMIAHPPCTYLTVSGNKWMNDEYQDRFPTRKQDREDALAFVRILMAAPIERIAIENPISVISSRIRQPDQVVQPWMFGHGEVKATCFWLKNLSPLEPTHIVSGRDDRLHRLPPGPDRWKERSKTFSGIAAAMADQWGDPEAHMPLLQMMATNNQGIRMEEKA
jgi:hypothetical protein